MKTSLARTFAIALTFIVGSAMAEDLLDDAEDTVREHPLITASTVATTGILITDHNKFASAEHFAETSYVAIRRDAATGGGQHLHALAALLEQADAERFGRLMQSNYALVFDGTGPQGLLDRIIAVHEFES